MTIVIATGLLLAGCGGSTDKTSQAAPTAQADHHIAAEVGGSAITTVSLQHWMQVLSPTRPLPEPPRYARCIKHEIELGARADEAGLRVGCEEQYLATRQRALSFLITLAWVERESSKGEFTQVATTGARGSSGAAKLLRGVFTEASGDDIRLLERDEAAISRLRAAVRAGEAPIAPGRVRRFYQENKRDFERPEKRAFNIVEQISSPAVARRLIASLQRSGDAISSLIVHQRRRLGVAIHEVRNRPASLAGEPPVWHLIFSAPPHSIVGPVPQFQSYAILEVARKVPASRSSLSEVAGAIRTKLQATQDARALGAFAKSWANRWKERTTCDPRYVVVEQCRDIDSGTAVQDPFTDNVLLEGVARAYRRY